MGDSEGPDKDKDAERAAPTPNQEQATDYIADISFELKRMADDAGLPFLSYMLEMVAEEAMRENDGIR